MTRHRAVGVYFVAQLLGLSMITLYGIPLGLGYDFFNELTAHVIGIGSTSVTSFLGHKYFSFNEERSLPSA